FLDAKPAVAGADVATRIDSGTHADLPWSFGQCSISLRPRGRARGNAWPGPWCPASSVIEDRQIECAKPLGVGEEVELDDLAIPDGDGGDGERLPVQEGDRAGNAVDQRRPDVQPDLGVTQRLARDCPGPAHLARAADRPEIGPQDDVRVEHGQKPVEVAVTRGRDKGVGDLTLRLDVCIGDGSLGAYAPARPAGEL